MPRTSARKIGLLASLYFAQGLPFGFQVTALPAYLRASGVSLVGIGFLGLLSFPWMAKALWAPLVDRYSSARFGRRKTWIVPAQTLLMIACALAALVPPDRGLFTLLALVFLMNLFAATQDIAVDGLAIDMLSIEELGAGNAVQVVGYKLGMLAGGGLLVYLSGWIGWRGLFGLMALLVAIVLAIVSFHREHEPSESADLRDNDLRIRDVLRIIGRAVRAPGSGCLLAFIATYKTGESMLDAMFKPFLVDAGHSPQTIGLWIGTYGMIASLLGSVAGGFLASRVALLRAVGIAALLRVLPMFFETWIAASGNVTSENVIAAVSSELFFGGALTTAMFAFMMSKVDRKIGATHYTLFASVEVLGKSASGWASGLIAEATSYAFLFGTATALSIAFLLLLIPLKRSASIEPR
jgi:MFS family permease